MNRLPILANIFVNSDWLSTGISICLSFLVFMFGVPLLFLQMVPENTRAIYSREFSKKWSFFRNGLIGIFILYILSVNFIEELSKLDFIADAIIGILFTGVILISFIIFWRFLFALIKDAENIELVIARKKIKSALSSSIDQVSLNSSFRDSISDLTTIGVSLSGGNKKELFYTECERLIISLTDVASQTSRIPNLIYALEELVVPCIVLPQSSNTPKNFEQALQIISDTHDRILIKNKLVNDPRHNLKNKITNCCKEIGLNAIHKGDYKNASKTLKRLANFRGAEGELFSLGKAAIVEKKTDIAVSAETSLRTNYRENDPSAAFPTDSATVHLFSYWFGMLAEINALGGFASEWAVERFKSLHPDPLRVPGLYWKKSENIFRSRSDFATVDAMRQMRRALGLP